ncbi:hypothetical protein O7627_08805 [Solwaraspora sp. WMMD1047]|uniref:hypothetical protein n=1 Tax=Solwaraspora sp. WMMD1047 TaxID=3016102 RepID=UPI0024163513|nr:hypothetical protein [Solwaraspora sp. WMMD1047]MDG4829403.1 hypothetical protein [Solwaraspora sp. WMMD1047]
MPPTPTGTLSGGHDPAAVPAEVQVDAFRMLLARHVPAADGRCTCGRPLGEETGRCHYARQAQKALTRLLGECP